MEEGRPRSSLSLASSVSTVSSISSASPSPPRVVSRVRCLGKRGSSLRRGPIPNLPVHIRGWMHKQDSGGLRLWKRRWFVLSGHCLFYYKGQQPEESVLGSVPLPSYSVPSRWPRGPRGRRYTFTAEHPGMRAYVLAADTMEDLRGWLRALGRATRAEGDDYGPQTAPTGPPTGEGPGGPGGPPEVGSGDEGRSAESLEVARISGGHRELTPSPPPGLTEPPQRSRQRSRSPELFSPLSRPPSPLGLPRPRSAPAHRPSALMGGDSRPHTPLSRIDVRPLPEWAPALRTLSRPSTPRRVPPSETGALRPPRSPQHWSTEPKAKAASGYPQLSPRPAGNRGSVASLQASHPPTSAPTMDSPLHRSADTDALLTKLCGQDRLLRRLTEEMAKNQEEKERLEAALELTRRAVGEPGPGGRAWARLRLLQDRLVGVRAALCHLAQERERVWDTYSGLEQELGTLRETLEDLLHLGPPQARVSAQQQLWMVEDTLAGLGDPRWGRPHGDGDGPCAPAGPGSPSSPRAQSPDGQCSSSPAPSPSPPPSIGPKALASRVRMSAQEQLERMRRHQEAGRLRLRPLSPSGQTMHPSAVRRQLEPGSERDAPLLDAMGHTGTSQQWVRSSGSWSSSRSPRPYISSPEGHRERVLSLSQALATEASQWHKFITDRSLEAPPDSASRLTPPPRSPPVGSPPPMGRGRGGPATWAPTWGGAAPPDEGAWPLRVTLLQSSF
ncbi:LOW QUALITY PROTEIN: pleckstrin homology domain-containing family A member 4 [Dromiciops gliroides]|uniref:LOW QUALITY PROTEIN: pleckstrin homology domain-containing family A member 4 n=1 Tax=Dromiciops gliroides TaxID=33562 RepID=UPI001CC54648|nr:LOW QUALITY PROTEIN: pleckstrin homology domain-containing family A member 4 [Dromiciops gliroides]